MGAEVLSPNCEMASVLFLDIVSYSLLSIGRQTEILSLLQQCVRNTTAFQNAQAAGDLICLPTGDGMALVFLRDPVAPVLCALEIASSLRSHSELGLRMGVHMGPVRRHADIKDEINVVGGGINMAQRVMNFGDAGHILLSRAVAEILEQLDEWRGCLQDLGTHEAKHGVRVHLYNFCKGELGNAETPRTIGALAAAAGKPETPAQTQDRALDVGMAREIPVRVPAELVALVRRSSSQGLRGMLAADPDFTIAPDDVRSKPLTLEFPLDRHGVPKALELTLRINAPDFEPATQSKVIRVPPDGESEPCTFLLTPTQLGDLRVNVELYAEKTILFSRSLKTCARQSDRLTVATSRVIVTIPLVVLVQPAAVGQAAVAVPDVVARLFEQAMAAKASDALDAAQSALDQLQSAPARQLRSALKPTVPPASGSQEPGRPALPSDDNRSTIFQLARRKSSAGRRLPPQPCPAPSSPS